MRVRLASTDDSPAVAEIYAPYVQTTVISFETTPPDAGQMAERIAATMPAHPWLLAEEAGTVLGYAYAHPFASRAAYAWSAETSVYVRPDRHRRGVGRSLYEVLLRLLAAQGYREAFAGVTLPNAASVALHEGMGFAAVGTYRRVGFKHGSWHDVGWWQRGLGGQGAPAAVRTVTDLEPSELARLLALPGERR
ncbi:MAG: family acetyltransferase [Frankiales bacterium]|jgi:L-amino acid N-acyltransferase YncA|nr:family acetyltransferase [Frankiales bacterium]